MIPSRFARNAYKIMGIIFIMICENEAQAGSFVVDTARALSVKGVLSMYPDLPTGNLDIKWENQPKGTANVVILDTADIEVFHTDIKINTSSGNTQIDLSKLKLGNYTIIINYEKTSFTERLSVQP